MTLRDGSTRRAQHVVIAAGAWTSQLTGLPRTVPVEPVRGEMIGFPVAATAHCIYGPGAYVVPRPNGRTIVGATMDRVGFDARTTSEARSRLHAAVARFLPALAKVAPDSHWAGLRPISADGLPIVGPDPRWPALIWATGHSRNGILLAPMTAESVAGCVSGESPRFDLSPFRPGRFE
ncbi:MAG: FAD-dependent oxidoreductase [Gemmatimonadetes bacterium]|nr:FAD-dependent oxidoreductase [Gemmatimonadota bacterium]